MLQVMLVCMFLFLQACSPPVEERALFGTAPGIDGIVFNFAGQPGQDKKGFQDGVQGALSIREAPFLNAPQGLELVGKSLYVADTDNNAIRKIDILTKEVTTIAGSSSPGDSPGNGPGSDATFNRPMGLFYHSPRNSLFVVDQGNKVIRELSLIKPDFIVSTFAGWSDAPNDVPPQDGFSLKAIFASLSAITGNDEFLYIADKNAIRRIVVRRKLPDGDFDKTVLDKLRGARVLFDDPSKPNHVYFDDKILTEDDLRAALLNLGIIDAEADNLLAVWRISRTGAVVTIAGIIQNSEGVVSAGLFDAGISSGVGDPKGHTINPETGFSNLDGDARFFNPTGLVLSSDGKILYVSDSSNAMVRMIRLDKSPVDVRVLAGKLPYDINIDDPDQQGSNSSSGIRPNNTPRDGFGTDAIFSRPAGMDTDGVDLFITDAGGGGTVRRLSLLKDMRVDTIAGGYTGQPGFREGMIGSRARFARPTDIVLSADGNALYVANTSFNNIAVIR